VHGEHNIVYGGCFRGACPPEAIKRKREAPLLRLPFACAWESPAKKSRSREEPRKEKKTTRSHCHTSPERTPLTPPRPR
jgi:hypothetical protein